MKNKRESSNTKGGLFLLLPLLLMGAGRASASPTHEAVSSDANSQQILFKTDFYGKPAGKAKHFGVNYFKPVIRGVLYRGGSAGTRRANDPDSGVLTRDQLLALCRAGFSKAVYAYGRSRHMIPSVQCTMVDGRANELSYEGVRYDEKVRFVEIIDEAIRGHKGPVYDHCWNGWHASGELAAVALKQFCGFSSEEAMRYWQRNRYDKAAVPSLLKRISNFRPVAGLSDFSGSQQQELCPPKP